jgi:hypothetical protein
MPRKFVVTKARLDRPTMDQDCHLSIGFAFFGGDKFPFVDERHRREMWEANRDEILAEYIEGKRPGRRPVAFWEYDRPDDLDAAECEIAAILALPALGEAEREATMAHCRWRVRIALLNGSSPAAARALALREGVPAALFAEMLPAAMAEQEAERQAWRLVCGRAGDA